MEKDRSTLNVLVLELATMIVAIALAFNADTLSTTSLHVDELVRFIIVNMIVIWFWWNYVMDRLEFPPRTEGFPFLDVLILIFISLFPFVLRFSSFIYVAGLLAILMLVWAAMLRGVIHENPGLEKNKRAKLDIEVYMRIIVGLIFILSIIMYFINYILGYMLFVATVFVIVLRAIIGRIKVRAIARRSRRG